MAVTGNDIRQAFVMLFHGLVMVFSNAVRVMF